MRQRLLLIIFLLIVPILSLSWVSLGFAHSRTKYCEDILKEKLGQNFPIVRLEGIVTEVVEDVENQTLTITIKGDNDKSTDGRTCTGIDYRAIGSKVLFTYEFLPVLEQKMPEGGDAGHLGK